MRSASGIVHLPALLHRLNKQLATHKITLFSQCAKVFGTGKTARKSKRTGVFDFKLIIK